MLGLNQVGRDTKVYSSWTVLSYHFLLVLKHSGRCSGKSCWPRKKEFNLFANSNQPMLMALVDTGSTFTTDSECSPTFFKVYPVTRFLS